MTTAFDCIMSAGLIFLLGRTLHTCLCSTSAALALSQNFVMTTLDKPCFPSAHTSMHDKFTQTVCKPVSCNQGWLTHKVVGRATQYQKKLFAIASICLGTHALLTVPDGKHCRSHGANRAPGAPWSQQKLQPCCARH